MRRHYWLGACLAVLLTSPLQAQEKTTQANGADLITSCRANSPACGAYLQGVLDMMIVARRDVCAAPRSDRERLRVAYLRWAEENTYFESVHMAAGAERAMDVAWPCRAKRGREAGAGS